MTDKKRIACRKNIAILNASGKSIHRGENNGRWNGGMSKRGNFPCKQCGKDRVCIKSNADRLCKECGYKLAAKKRLGVKLQGNYARGDKHYNWNGGKTLKNHLFRTNIEYRSWRRQVFERDNFVCQICGKRGDYLQADHIKPFSLFPKLRYEINNGRTLCKNCHSHTETFCKSKNQLLLMFSKSAPKQLTYAYS